MKHLLRKFEATNNHQSNAQDSSHLAGGPRCLLTASVQLGTQAPPVGSANKEVQIVTTYNKDKVK